MSRSVLRLRLRLRLRLLLMMFACAVIVCDPTIVFAAPLFFDCHGTVESTSTDEKPEYHRKPMDWSTQIMIDPERGAFEGPGGGTNEYCERESDWMQVGASPLMRKIIKDCTKLQISETAYNFTNSSVFSAKVSDQPSLPERKIQRYASGSLNRVTGEFSAEARMKGGNGDSSDNIVWKMTCVPGQRKF